MKMWQAGCGVTALGIIATIGSCGLFGMSIQRGLEQRQILMRELDVPQLPSTAEFSVDDEEARVRVDFVAGVRPLEDDFADADSSSTIASSTLAFEYTVLTSSGEILERGAGTLAGSEIIPAADRRDGSPFGDEITLTGRGSAFDVEGPAMLTVEVDFAREDAAGRPLVRAQVLAFDRLGSGAGGLAAGGLLSIILGPMIAGLGILLLLAGLIFGKKKSTA